MKVNIHICKHYAVEQLSAGGPSSVSLKYDFLQDVCWYATNV